MSSPEKELTAVLYSEAEPTAQQRARFEKFLAGKYGREVPLIWMREEALRGGFRLEVGTDIYDWSLEGRMRQFRERLQQLDPGGEQVVPLMREAVKNWTPSVAPEEIGTVVTAGDEIATVSGLAHAQYGEILQFSSGLKGMVQDLRRDEVGCILFGDSGDLVEGSIVRRTGRTAGMPVGEGFLGRVVDALGTPIDGKGDIQPRATAPSRPPPPPSSTASPSTPRWRRGFCRSTRCSPSAAASVS